MPRTDIDTPIHWVDGLGVAHDAPSHRARLTAVLAREDLSHFSYRAWCGIDHIYAYRRDSGGAFFALVDTFPDCPEIRAIIGSRGVQAGGQMGSDPREGR